MNYITYVNTEYMALNGQMFVKYEIEMTYHYYSDGYVSGRVNNWVFSWPQCENYPYIVSGASCVGGTLKEKEQLAVIVNEHRQRIENSIFEEEQRKLVEKQNKVIMLYDDEITA